MPEPALPDLYRAYLDCLNRQAWDELGRHVDAAVEHNGRPFGLAGYRAMLVQDFEDIPDLRFEIALVASTPPLLSARLDFDCAPKGRFLGLDVNGRRLRFSENVFYAFRDGKIARVWSVIDKAAIESQLGTSPLS